MIALSQMAIFCGLHVRCGPSPPPVPLYNRGIGLYGAPSVRASHTARPTVDFMYNRNQNIFMVLHECAGKEQVMDGKNIHISEPRRVFWVK